MQKINKEKAFHNFKFVITFEFDRSSISYIICMGANMHTLVSPIICFTYPCPGL